MLGFNISTVMPQTLGSLSEQSCTFTDMRISQILAIDAEKHGRPLEISWSPNDNYMAVGTVHDSLDSNTKPNLFAIWDTQTWEQIFSFELPGDYYAQSISWSPDSTYVVIFYRDRLMAWNTSTWDHTEITVPEMSIYRVSWTNDNELVTLSDTGAWLGTDIKPYGNVPRLWNVTDGTLIQDFGVIGLQADIAFMDDRWLIVTSTEDALRAYYIGNEEHNLIQLQNAQLVDMAVNTNTIYLATATQSQPGTQIQVWDLTDNNELLSVSDVEYTGGGRLLEAANFLLVYQYSGAGEIWDIEAQVAFPNLNVDRQDYRLIRADWSLATMCVAATTYPDSNIETSALIYLLDVASGQQITHFKGHSEGYYVSRLAWSTSGQQLASSSSDSTIIIWQA
ncbi:MAG: WD40 repeat domain-containing protein [Chloroflexota bacterium]